MALVRQGPGNYLGTLFHSTRKGTEMPTPLDLLLDPIALAVFGIYAAIMLWEALAPARPLPEVPGWKWRGVSALIAFFFVSSYLPLMWGEYLGQFTLVDLTGLGTWGGALAGLLAYEAGVYFWHRSLHGSSILWRSFHQMHHSAERVDTYGAFWFSPLDMIGWTVLGSLTLVAVVGITPEAATVVLLATSFLAMFQHANIRTPQWLGYFVQRPESHARHHQRGVHAGNYSDLPLFDLLFGTFRNPREFPSEGGFYHGASARVGEMLCFRDVSTPAGHAESGSSTRAALTNR